jgi:hypothetical protein
MSRVHIEGDHVSLRPLRTDEFEAAWEAWLDADPSPNPSCRSAMTSGRASRVRGSCRTGDWISRSR